jgi:antitoxin ParD1/3/4
MGLELTPEQEEVVRTLFRSGNYTSESEVVHEALGLLGKRDAIRAELSVGLAELDRGENIDSEDIIKELEFKAARLTGSDQ